MASGRRSRHRSTPRAPGSADSPASHRTTGAAVVILDGADRLLLIRENYGHHRWGLPGGASEVGETPEMTALREAAEETGLSIEVGYVVGTYVIDIAVPHEVTVFRASVGSGELRVPPSGEIAEVGWFALDEIPEPSTNVLPAVVDDLRAGVHGERRHVPNTY